MEKMGNIIRRSAKGRSECAEHKIVDSFVLFIMQTQTDEPNSQYRVQLLAIWFILSQVFEAEQYEAVGNLVLYLI